MSKIRTGVIVGGFAAALLVAPQAAFAAPTTMGPPIVAPGGTATISDPAGPFTATTPTVQVSFSACPAKLAATAANGPWNAASATRSSANSVSFPLPGGLGSGPNGAVKAYYACVYDGAVATTSNLQAGTLFYVGQPVATSATSGVSGGGNQITVNGSAFSAAGSVGAVFSATACSSSLGTTNPANLVPSNFTRQSTFTIHLTVPSGVVAAGGPSPTMYNLCFYDTSAATSSLLTFVPYAVHSVGLNPASGSYLSTVGVTATSPQPFLSGITAPAAMLISGGGCPAVYSTTVANSIALTAPGAVRRLTNNRAALTIPPLAQGGYQVCFYANNSSTGGLLGTAGYTAAVVAAPTGVLPSAGPASGGNTITVVGNDFPTEPGRITATLGGVPLTNIQPVSDKAFTAVAPSHSVEANVALVVTTSSGTKALTGAYSYLNPLKVFPNTSPNTAANVDVSVQGLGFMSVNFGIGGNAARVFLVDGVYDGSDAGAGARANGAVAECVNVLPIGDDELICTLQLNRRLNANGLGFFDPSAYNNGVTDVVTVAGSRVISSPSGKFHRNDAGQPVAQGSNPNIPPNTIVSSVLSNEKAVLSQPATASSSGQPMGIGGSVRILTNAVFTSNGSSTVGLSAGGTFSGADVGRLLTGVGIPYGTTIVAVAPGGASATISQPATASTQAVITDVTVAPNSNLVNAAALTSSDQNAVVGPNTLGIPAGATFISAGGGSASLSMPATTGGTGSLTINRPVTATLFAAAPVPQGSYHLTVVSNGALDAAQSDPEYWQTDLTSSSVFTVAAF